MKLGGLILQCPRCDFEQPDDRYCARCGIDMILFEKPGLTPWSWIGSWWMKSGFFLFLAFTLVGATSIFLLRSYQDYRQKRVQVSSTLGEIFKLVDSLAPSPAPHQVSPMSVTETSAPDEPPEPSAGAAVALSASTVSTSTTLASASVGGVATEQKFSLSVIEMPTAILDQELGDLRSEQGGWLPSNRVRDVKVRWTEIQAEVKDLILKVESLSISSAGGNTEWILGDPANPSNGLVKIRLELSVGAEGKRLKLASLVNEPMTSDGGGPTERVLANSRLADKVFLYRGILRRLRLPPATTPAGAPAPGAWANDPVLRFWSSSDADQTELCLIVEPL